MCPSCNNNNFAFRMKCKRCDAERPEDAGQPSSGGGQINHQKREGDWDCAECGNDNFAFRDSCNRCKAPRGSSGAGGAAGGAVGEKRELDAAQADGFHDAVGGDAASNIDNEIDGAAKRHKLA